MAENPEAVQNLIDHPIAAEELASNPEAVNTVTENPDVLIEDFPDFDDFPSDVAFDDYVTGDLTEEQIEGFSQGFDLNVQSVGGLAQAKANIKNKLRKQ